MYKRILIFFFFQNVIKISILAFLRMCADAQKFSPSGSSSATSRKIFGWLIRLYLHTFVAQHIAVYILYTYTREYVSEPLMRTPADGISDK